MEPLLCSLGECRKQLLGYAVVIGRVDDEEMVGGEHLHIYQGSLKPFALLHPNCFKSIIDEMAVGEAATSLYLMMGQMSDIRIALEM